MARPPCALEVLGLGRLVLEPAAEVLERAAAVLERVVVAWLVGPARRVRAAAQQVRARAGGRPCSRSVSHPSSSLDHLPPLAGTYHYRTL